MKRLGLFLIGAVALIMITGCYSVSSQVTYPEAIVASETRLFVGKGQTYAEAREEAILAANEAGFTKIVSETTETEWWLYTVVVSLTMIR
jgi:hypothetical protein